MKQANENEPLITLDIHALFTFAAKMKQWMINSSHFTKLGKKLSYLLRHDKSYAFDEHGWREVGDLLDNHGFTMEELREIVATNNKQRYEFS